MITLADLADITMAKDRIGSFMEQAGALRQLVCAMFYHNDGALSHNVWLRDLDDSHINTQQGASTVLTVCAGCWVRTREYMENVRINWLANILPSFGGRVPSQAPFEQNPAESPNQAKMAPDQPEGSMEASDQPNATPFETQSSPEEEKAQAQGVEEDTERLESSPPNDPRAMSLPSGQLNQGPATDVQPRPHDMSQ